MKWHFKPNRTVEWPLRPRLFSPVAGRIGGDLEKSPQFVPHVLVG
jgi:hypothetical protein